MPLIEHSDMGFMRLLAGRAHEAMAGLLQALVMQHEDLNVCVYPILVIPT